MIRKNKNIRIHINIKASHRISDHKNSDEQPVKPGIILTCKMNNFSISGDFSNQFLCYHHFPKSTISYTLQKWDNVIFITTTHCTNKHIEESMGLIIVHNRLAEKTKNVSITIKEPQRIWDQTDVQIIFSRAYASVNFLVLASFPKLQ